MNRNVAVLAAAVAILFSATALAAPKGISKAEAEQLVKGNTAIGSTRFDKTMIWYFDPMGQVRTLDAQNNKGKAKWHIDKQGGMCYQNKHMREERCTPIIKRPNGKYEIHFDAEWRWNSIEPGNPKGL